MFYNQGIRWIYIKAATVKSSLYVFDDYKTLLFFIAVKKTGPTTERHGYE